MGPLFGRQREGSPPTDPYRPRHHVSPPSGWMNDPCGLVYADGRYHLYYQHFPGATFWGPMHWGHAASPDLVTWTHEPVALAPDPELGMAFTGSALHDDRGRLRALLTHHGGAQGGEKVSLATSEDGGRSWRLDPGNPVLPPSGESPFRDPKVFRHPESGAWVLAIAAGDGVALYRSDDLRRWTRSDHVLLEDERDEDDGVWECPELLRLPVEDEPGRHAWLLKVDRNRLQADYASSLYWTGDFDGRRFELHDPQPRLVDHGRDFYAAQAWNDAPGEAPVWIAWMSNWRYGLVTPTRIWRGMMTLPRRLSLRRQGGRLALVQRPVLPPTLPRNPDRGTAYALPLPGDFGKIRLRAGDGEATHLSLDLETATLALDRRRSGDTRFHASFPEVHEARLTRPEAGLLVVVDHSSVEVFADDGATVLSDRIFPSLSSDGIE